MALLLNEQEKKEFIERYYTLPYTELKKFYPTDSRNIKDTAIKLGIVKKPQAIVWENWQMEILLEPISDSKAARLIGTGWKQVKKKREQLKLNGL